VFSSIEPGLVSGLITEAVEWKRSYGRTSRQVYVECEFQQWNMENVSSGSSVTNIQGQPVFHTYWTGVTDVDLYRQTVKEDIINWLAMLRKTSSFTDWMIILVETPEGRKVSTKFPLRATVLDKLKQDIGGKTPERCVSLTDPSRTDSRAAESMQSFLHKFRQFFLQSYNKVLNKFEENIRSQREKRNEPSWNFCQYFLLQEQLAFVYENMGLYDEALIQYDELDALLTQFVLNSNVGHCPDWLQKFNKDLSDWRPLSLDTKINSFLREKLEQKCPSLMDIRNYLFSQQCHQLVLSHKTNDVAARTISFLHNMSQELEILEIKEVVQGSLDSWVLLACLEVVQTCDKRTEDSSGPGNLTVHTASLWSLAREKLLKLGELCGLLPGQAPSSDQLHSVITLTGGLPDEDDTPGPISPCRRLKESLSSNNAFQRNYLEMCEIAISSFKHIGRIRSARLVGRDLASFYMQMGENFKATTFLVEALKTFQQERWFKLSLQTMLDLAQCYNKMEDKERYVRICAEIASCPATTFADKCHYFDEFKTTLKDINNEENLILPSDDVFRYTSCNLTEKTDQIIPGNSLVFNLVLHNFLPKRITCDSVKVALAFSEINPKLEDKVDGAAASIVRKPVARSPSVSSNNNSHFELSIDTTDTQSEFASTEDDQLDIIEQLDYKQDKSLCSARLVCRNTSKALTRKDSSGSMLRDLSSQHKSEYVNCIAAENIVLEPGDNTIELHGVAGTEGKYSMVQMSVKIERAEFLCDIIGSGSSQLYYVISTPPTLALSRHERELYAGLDNCLQLNVETGSQVIPAGTKISLQSSRGLTMKADEAIEYSDKIEVVLPGGDSYETISVKFFVKCVLSNQKDSSSIEHKIMISNPWSGKIKDAFIHFTPAFYTTFHLLTALDKKFLQIFVFPVSDLCFVLSGHKLELDDQDLSLSPINKDDDILISDSNCEAGYLWQLNIPKAKDYQTQEARPVKAKFSLQYKDKSSMNESATDAYEASFQFENFLTLYTIQAKVEPLKGNEFCRAATMCPMTITLEQCNQSQYSNLYYEVIADQSVWAVCGRQGAVLNMENNKKQSIIVEVMPLIGGQLALPSVRLSKYIPADNNEGGAGAARLDPFSMGEVYNMSRSQQVHVLPGTNSHQLEFNSLQ